MFEKLEAPFPYFGGKMKIAPLVWHAFGDVKHYIEPFFGSGAVLLSRPNHDPTTHVETINDKDGFVANVWRALQADPDAVAKYCDWPVNHLDLNARRFYMREKQDELFKKLGHEPDFYDVKLAGYWIWASSCWIGSGLTMIDSRPHLTNAGMGVQEIGQRPHLTAAGMGVHKIGKRPHLTDSGKGVQEPYNPNLYTWLRRLSERLRHVRVVCGDWSRVCGGNWQDNLGVVGIYFDPPYAVEDRDDVYAHESRTVGKDVESWCLERGGLRSYRIVVSGYESEYQSLVENGWSTKSWSTNGGYGKLSGKNGSRGQDNRSRETLFISPHCLDNGQPKQKTLWDEVGHGQE